MTLTFEQQLALDKGEAIALELDGRECVILLRHVYEQAYDDGDWTDEERALLAAELEAILDDDMAIED